MHRGFIHHPRVSVLLSVAIFAVAVPAFSQSQSLGDIARENRDKKAAEQSSTAAPAPPVITNATIPKDPDAITTATTAENSTRAAARARHLSDRRALQLEENQRHTAEQWKRKIQQQESTVANLRSRVDRLRASIRFADPNHYYATGTNYDYAGLNRAEARDLQRLAQLQQQFNDEKRKLEDMQDAARHAGMHTPVYDP